MMEKRVELIITRKWLMIFAVIFVLLDVLSTWLVARTDLELFMLNELNALFKLAFLQTGWYAFLIYPFLQISLYFLLIQLTFAFYTRYKKNEKGTELFKPSFYFPMALLSFHLWVIVNNFLLFTRIANFI
ncbi:membrane hypothetical protein [Gammaproteobacteria bacterium]